MSKAAGSATAAEKHLTIRAISPSWGCIPLVAVAVVVLAGSVFAQHDHHGGHQALGKVHFPIACRGEAQTLFDRAMLYQHSFWYSAARQAYEQVLRADPDCAIAYWGIAQSLLLNPFGPTPASNLQEGRALIAKARGLAGVPERERAYIDAIGSYYEPADNVSQRDRLQAYVKATEAVAQKYPADEEAQIFHALALNMAAPPNDKSYALQLKAAAILEPIFARRPEHPGVAHYLIHTYDYPAIAGKGLAAAKRYAEIAGASPHALHMPSHIFTRAGLWQDSIASNIRSAQIAKTDKEPDDQLHAMDYMVYAYLQLAQDAEARAVLDEMQGVTGINESRHTGPFALAASAARYALEHGDWAGAARLPARPSRFAHVDAMTHFARALGAARAGRPAEAAIDIARLAELRDKLHEQKNGYWAEQVDIQWRVAGAWKLHAEGEADQALAALGKAADAEDATEKHVVTPGPLLPARELLAEMMLGRAMAKEALREYESVLMKEPVRLRAAFGAGEAAEKAGDAAAARRYYAKVAELPGGDRAEVRKARAFVAAGR